MQQTSPTHPLCLFCVVFVLIFLVPLFFLRINGSVASVQSQSQITLFTPNGQPKTNGSTPTLPPPIMPAALPSATRDLRYVLAQFLYGQCSLQSLRKELQLQQDTLLDLLETSHLSDDESQDIEQRILVLRNIEEALDNVLVQRRLRRLQRKSKTQLIPIDRFLRSKLIKNVIEARVSL